MIFYDVLNDQLITLLSNINISTRSRDSEYLRMLFSRKSSRSLKIPALLSAHIGNSAQFAPDLCCLYCYTWSGNVRVTWSISISL